jgi:protein-disulfide isomerase/uncharacterized membrane protein
MDRRRAVSALLLAVVGAALSGLLLLEHHGERPGEAAAAAVCGDGSESGCDVVARSPYSSIGGLPVAALGVAFYASMAALLLLALLGEGPVLVASARLGAFAFLLALAVDVLLFGIQAFVIRAFCVLCISTYVVNFAALLALLPASRATSGAGPLRAGEGRLVIAGWAVASVILAGAVVAADSTLSLREERRRSGILGTAPTEAASQANDEVRRLKEILDDPQKREQYLSEKALADFEAAQPVAFDLASAPAKGSPEAPLQVVEFSDFLCPYCRSLAQAFAAYVPRSAGRVALHFKNYPLDKACNPALQNTVHEGACWLARGGICAQAQGRFWPYHDKVFSSDLVRPTREDVARLATEAGLDGRTLGDCLGATGTLQRLQADIAEATRAQVQATPTVFINGKPVIRVSDFLLAVDRESARLGLPTQRGTGGP